MKLFSRALVLGLLMGLLALFVVGLTGSVLAEDASQGSAGLTAEAKSLVIPGDYLSGPSDAAPIDIAREFLSQNKEALGLTEADLVSSYVSDMYSSEHTGVTHIYLQQESAGITVHNAILNINISSDGRVINVGNRFVVDLAQRVNTAESAVTAIEAAEAAAARAGLEVSEPFEVIEDLGGASQAVVLSTGGIAIEAIPVSLVYQPMADGQARLAWQVGIYQLDQAHYWSARVDAATGKVLEMDDLVIHDSFGESAGSSSAGAAAEVTESPAPAQSNLNPDSYEVFAMPSEYPDDGPRVIATDPANATASPFGWHDTDGAAGAEFTITRGNNASAYQDQDNDGTPEPGEYPDAGPTLDFTGALVPLDLAQDPLTYINAAITNLFYWNNIIHDVFYLYGFDEESGNFQVNNYGNPGLGNDDVRAEGQDGSGLNNANFFTPVDGQRPRMQMYLWNQTTPRRDGDLENSIIVHEYGHGISNRLTGGPSNVSCLNNSEQMGEGWSDWLPLTLTAKVSDTGPTSRGIGTYVLGQPTTGVGIRPAPYSTDFGLNNFTYANLPGMAVPHGVGFIWATMTWDMYWQLVDKHGFNTDFYGDWSTGGNNLSIQLIMDGMKLQPCSPGFVDGRDAILQADLVLTGGANQCEIWEGFAGRGLGYSASQGSTSSTSDGTPAFDMPPGCLGLSTVPEDVTVSVCAGGDAAYTVSVGASFTPPVTMSGSTTAPSASVGFIPNPVPGPLPQQIDMEVSTSPSTPFGTYDVEVHGDDGVVTDTIVTTLSVFDAAPGAPTLTVPANGAINVPIAPAFEWNAAAQGDTYHLEVATDAGFTNIVYDVMVDGTTHQATALDPLTTYFWRVSADNPCGAGPNSAVFSFTTMDIPPILLVDDDDNLPDVQATYVTAMNAIFGIDGYDVWDTNNSDNEPDAATLSAYDVVVWFTGDEFGGFAGPGAAGEAALASWLNDTGCLFISSQDYHYDRNLTPFMTNYLGAAAITDDNGNYSSVTGQGTVFGGLGPYTLSYPFTDYSDVITANGTAELAFDGNNGNDAAIFKDSGTYQTTFWVFPWEALPNSTAREETLNAFFNACDLEQVPEINVTPLTIDEVMYPYEVEVNSMTIANPGSAELTWTIEEAPADCGAPADLPWVTLSMNGGTTGAGNTTNVDVTFEAGATAGDNSGKLCISSDAVNMPLVEVDLSMSVELINLFMPHVEAAVP